ncbi:MAG: 4-hydroxy-tetrahydrodipicolinate synthase [Oscillospiraceae bacterium]|nr:4-hydroxy-tetrahydrodipicolinate synthase [Oscillospiraceae bacterium]
MTKTPVFKGSCTAIVTPFAEHGIDYERLLQQLDRQYEGGTAAIVVCGTTGENATLSIDEHNELVRRTVNACRGRMKTIVGVGGNDTRAVLRKAENARAIGADAILMTTPYYNKTSQKGLVEHFSYVADRVDLPMILYNVPSRTGISIHADTYHELSKHPNINGVKEASGDFSLIARTRSLCGDDLFLWSGNDDNTIPMMALGALGVISVASNLVPSAVSELCSLCLEGEYRDATTLYSRYAALFSTLFIETNPMPVKAAMRLAGLDSGIVRLPLTQISEDHLEQLRRVMQELDLTT